MYPTSMPRGGGVRKAENYRNDSFWLSMIKNPCITQNSRGLACPEVREGRGLPSIPGQLEMRNVANNRTYLFLLPMNEWRI